MERAHQMNTSAKKHPPGIVTPMPAMPVQSSSQGASSNVGPVQLSIKESIAAGYRQEPLNKIIARLVAKDRIPMYTIAKSEDIRLVIRLIYHLTQMAMPVIIYRCCHLQK